jgi:hypothetical protein
MEVFLKITIFGNASLFRYGNKKVTVADFVILICTGILITAVFYNFPIHPLQVVHGIYFHFYSNQEHGREIIIHQLLGK